MRRITCPHGPSLNETDNLSSLFTIFLFVNTICNVITVNIFLICWHMEGLLHPGGPVITWLSVGREQTDVLNLSMTGWPVWLGDLYDWATSMTCMTRWLLSPDDLYHWATSILVWLGNLYDLHDQATSITGWLLWPACPSDIYEWVTSMTMWPVWPQWLDDLYDLATSMTRWLLWLCGATPWRRLAPFLACSLPSYYYSPRIHKHSLTLACKHNLTLTEPDQCPRVHTPAN